MVAASEAFNEWLVKLGQQHEHFLREACDLSFEALKAENRRLVQELGLLRAAVGTRAGHAQPGTYVSKSKTFADTDGTQGLSAVQQEREAWTYPAGNLGVPDHQSLVQLRPKATIDEIRLPPQPPRQPPRLFLEDPTVASAEIISPPPYLMDSRCPSAESGESRHRRPPTREQVVNSSPRELMHKGYTMEVERSIPSKEKPKPAIQPLPVVASDIDEKIRSRQVRRIQTLFGLEGSDDISVNHLYVTLQERSAHFKLDRDQVAEVLAQLKAVPGQLPPPNFIFDDAPDGYINPEALAQILLIPNLLSYVDEEEAERVWQCVHLLNVTTVNEVIEEATKMSIEVKGKDTTLHLTLSSVLYAFVSVTILVNVTSMGISVDHHPSSFGWFGLDILCCAVFVLQAIAKLCTYGPNVYFWGEGGRWNQVDFATTCVSIFESSLFGLVVIPAHGKAPMTTRVVLFLRVFRLVRLVRLMLLQSYLMKDLANMLVGFVIGLPSLMWVLLVFLFVLYCVGLTFRLCFGPSEGQNYLAHCPTADLITTDFYNPDCPVHYLYGEEFFGTMPRAMFTTFRFMIGDTFTRAGNSLVVAFSEGYGLLFDFIYVTFMIVVMFGFFNIITAIFVDSTTTGLKNSDSKKKLSRQYERSYVKKKLKMLIERIQMVCQNGLGGDMRPTKMGFTEDAKVSEHDFRLTQADFIEVMGDQGVCSLLEELDVEVFNPDSLFDTFDPDGTGFVTVPNLVEAVMRLRGVPQKNDVIGAWVAVRSLAHRFEQFQIDCLESFARLEASVTMALKEGSDTDSQVGSATMSAKSTLARPFLLKGISFQRGGSSAGMVGGGMATKPPPVSGVRRSKGRA